MKKHNSHIIINGRHYDLTDAGRHLAVGRAPEPLAPITKPSLHDVIRPYPRPAHPHAPHHSETLMRHVVKRPNAHHKSITKAAAPTRHAVKHLDIIHGHQPGHHPSHIKRVKKSPLIRHFGAVQPTIPDVTSPPAAHHAQPAHHVAPAATKPPRRAAEALFERALEHATAHEQPPVKRKRLHLFKLKKKRFTGAKPLVIAAVLLGGFLVYANQTAIRVQVASAKAGFSASLPAYQPTGYRLSHLAYGKGQVNLGFAGDSNHSYAITEKPSAWDTQTLHDSFVANLNQSYETVETAGRTLYVYGQNNATWVSGGVWYQIQADGSLDVKQLVQLAASM